MYLANETEKPKLRFVIRDGIQVLQERLKTRKGFKYYEIWADVLIETETTEPSEIPSGYTMD